MSIPRRFARAWARRTRLAFAGLGLGCLLCAAAQGAKATATAAPASSAEQPTRLAEAFRKPISIEFKEVGLQTVFEIIARSSGLNILFDKEVRGEQKVSLYLKDATVEKAVNALLLTQQLAQRVIDANTLLIYPDTAARQKDHAELGVQGFYLAHAEAKTVAATLKALLKAQNVVIDDKLNLLIVRDSAPTLALASQLVALHDVPDAEVMLDVEIAEVKRGRLQELGLRWPDQLSLTPLPSTSGAPLTLADLRSTDSARTGAALGPLTLNLRKTDSDADILANPRIRARNREKARILIGERVPNITATSTATGFVAESVNYVDVGLKLEVEPTVFADGEVAIKVALEVSNIINQVQTKQGSVAFQIGTRSAQTVLRLKDGESQLLAGLINDEDRRLAHKVPLLGDIPLLGRLFGSRQRDAVKTEIVLSITPRVLRGVTPPAAAALRFPSGTESRPATQPLNTLGAEAQDPAASTGPATAPAATPATSASPPAATPAAELIWDAPAHVTAGEAVDVSLRWTGEPTATLPALTLGFDPQAVQLLSALPAARVRIDPAGQLLVAEGMPAAEGLLRLRLRALQGARALRLQALGSAGPWPVPALEIPVQKP